MIAGSLRVPCRALAALAAATLSCTASPVFAASPDPAGEPAVEARIRAEGLGRSAAIDHAAALTDGIGDRLTASPNHRRAIRWSIAALRRTGLANAHVERHGPMLVSWRQTRAWLRMTAPDTRMLHVAVAPWSAPSGGLRRAVAIHADVASVADFARFRGRLRGRIVFLGPVRAVPQPVVALSHRIAPGGIDAELAPLRRYHATRDRAAARQIADTRWRRALAAFLTAEGVAAVVVPAAETADGGGTGLLTTDDRAMPVAAAWRPENRLRFPVFVAGIEDYGRVARLARRGGTLAFDYAADTVADGLRAVENVVADLPGGDPAVAGQIVLAGAHLDSWIGGTGATDNAAGVAITLEAVRILSALGLKPRRTIRVVLYGGEEQGLLGSAGHARRHLGTVPRADDPTQRDILVAGRRRATGPARPLPGHARLSIAFNVDSGGGRVRGLFTGGNPALAEVARTWIAPLADLGVEAVLDEPSWPADQTSFTDLGLPAIDLLQDPLDYDTRTHHTDMDTFERLSPDDLAQAATVLAILLWRACDAPAMMPRVALPQAMRR